jgi:CheY-like chemotaxis protein
MIVLIADDDPLIIRLLSTELRKAGFATFVAYDVVQSMTTIRRNRIDAVVLDMSMPGGSGADVIHRLTSSNRNGQIPILVVSGSVGPEDRDKIIAAGADAFFLKPPDVPALIETLRALSSPVAGSPNVRQLAVASAGAADPDPVNAYCGA